MKASALVITGPRTMELGQHTVPELGDDDVLIRTEYSGVSQGTEVDAFRGDRRELTFPTITGYQSVGIIEAAGPAVRRFAVGDRVLFNTSRLPADYPFTWMGSHVSHAVVSTTSRPPLAVPADVDPVEAALTAMVAVSLGGIQQITVALGDVVHVNGQGLIGQASAQLARARGAYVIASDLSPLRRDLSAQFSADIVVDPREEDLDALVRAHASQGVDIVIETSGRADQVAPSIERIKTGGTLLLQGYYRDRLDIDFHPTHIKKPSIVAACGFGDLKLALTLLQRGRARFGGLVTHLSPPEQAPELFARMDSADPGILGVVFDWTNGAP